MLKYECGKIYKLQIDNLIYIGSTTKDLNERLKQHHIKFKIYQNKKSKYYISSFELFKNKIIPLITLLELVPCKSKNELLERERFYIENTECVNKIKKVTLTEEERNNYCKNYYENNKDKIKEYYENNKDNIKDKIKEYNEKNKDKIKDKIKEYYENNKEKNLKKKKEYYERKKSLKI